MARIQAALREIGEPLIVGLLHESLHLTKCICKLRAGLYHVKKDFDLTIELEGYTKADIADVEPGGVTVLYGVVPQTLNGQAQRQTKKPLTHWEKDRQLKALSQRLADLLAHAKMILTPCAFSIWSNS